MDSIDIYDNPLGLQVHKLNIFRFGTSNLSNARADEITEDASAILGQCRVSVIRNNNVSVITTGNGIINSESDFRAICSSAKSSSTTKGLFRNVFVVNRINWCGVIKPNVIGCANTPGSCIVVVRFSNNLEGHLWAHEFAHTRGVRHRNTSGALMFPSIGVNNRNLNSNECSVIRRRKLSLRDLTTMNRLNQIDIVDFVQQSFTHGIPYEIASKYSAQEGNRIIPILQQNAKDKFWSNIVIVLGMIGVKEFTNTLISFIEQNDNAEISLNDYNARTSAIIALGYIANKSKDNKALEYLKDGLDIKKWEFKKLIWKAPFQSSLDERNIDLYSSSALGLALSGNEKAESLLWEKVNSQNLKNDKLLNSTLPTLSNCIDECQLIREVGLENYYKKHDK